MRILFLGAGALGGYFGGRMTAAGADVTFLVRERRAEQLANGLKISSPFGDATIPVQTMQAGDQADPFDVIVLTNKAYGLEGALDAIASYVDDRTGILPFLNGVAHYDAVDARFPDAVRLGGVAQIPANLAPDGTVSHNGKLQSLIAGTRDSSDRARELVQGFVSAALDGGIDAKTSEAIEQDLWNKWVFLATLAASTTLMGVATGDIVATDHGEAFIFGLLSECSQVAKAEGRAPDDEKMAFYHGQLSRKGNPFKSSMLHDIEAGNPIEADHIVGDMIRRARKHGIATPLLEVALTRLQIYETGRSG